DAHGLGKRNIETRRATQTVDHYRPADCPTGVIASNTGKGLEHIVGVAHARRAGVDRPDAQQGRIDHLLDSDVVALLAGFRLEQRSLSFDGDGLRSGSDLQTDVFPEDL